MIAKSTADNHAGAGRTAVFGGSFNPFTVGHASIVERGLGLFDTIVIAIGINASKKDTDDMAADRRKALIEKLYAGNPRVKVVVWDGLMVDLARKEKARFFLRGVRSSADFEYERSMADINRRLTGIETVLLFTLPEHAAISSSVVRELRSYGLDVSPFLPRTNSND